MRTKVIQYCESCCSAGKIIKIARQLVSGVELIIGLAFGLRQDTNKIRKLLVHDLLLY